VAQFICVPLYTPDSTSGEVVTGYDLQSTTCVTGNPDLLNGASWAEVSGSPFVSNVNIFDPNGLSATTWYQVRPVRQVTLNSQVYTLDTPWSKPFQATTTLYDSVFTLGLLPTLRFTLLKDQGISAVNGTVLTETMGAGNGLWVFDGATTRYQLQYVINDDPIKVLDGFYTMIYTASGGSQRVMVPYQDYQVDTRAGTVTFATPPGVNDYARFEFRQVDMVNDDLLLALADAVSSASSYGLGGYQLSQRYNLNTMNVALKNPDAGEIICKIAVHRMHEGLVQNRLRAMTAWHDGSIQADPMPNRDLEFVVGMLDVTEQSIRRDINTYIRQTTAPRHRGEFEIFWDLSQLTPLTSGMFRSMPGGAYGTIGSGLGSPIFPWYLAWLLFAVWSVASVVHGTVV
jgi:hypothetical protein